jgi:hypothetical protein
MLHVRNCWTSDWLKRPMGAVLGVEFVVSRGNGRSTGEREQNARCADEIKPSDHHGSPLRRVPRRLNGIIRFGREKANLNSRRSLPKAASQGCLQRRDMHRVGRHRTGELLVSVKEQQKIQVLNSVKGCETVFARTGSPRRGPKAEMGVRGCSYAFQRDS